MNRFIVTTTINADNGGPNFISCMTAIILAPGPSLESYEPRSADICICINRAALKFNCGWFAALDYPMIRDNAAKVLGSPCLLSRRQTVMDLGPPRLTRFHKVTLLEDVLEECRPPGMKDFNTAQTALLFAAWRGASRITVFGADWNGVKDYDGVKAGEDRSDDRWKREREAWDGVLVPYLAGRGVIVERR